MGIVAADISVSVDGYNAGPNQSLDKPFGEGIDDRLHGWMFEHGDDNRAEIDAISAAGASIMGRNDELRLHIVPDTVGAGERIFDGVGGLTLEARHVRGSQHVLHVTYGVSR